MQEVIRLLHSHYPWDYIKKLRPKNIVEFLIHAQKQENKSKAWDMWIARYPTMTKEKFISFQDFYKKLTTPVQTVKKGGKPPIKIYEHMKNKVKRSS